MPLQGAHVDIFSRGTVHDCGVKVSSLEHNGLFFCVETFFTTIIRLPKCYRLSGCAVKKKGI